MADNGLLCAYLMVGADELKREFLLERLSARVAQLGDIDFNRDMFIASGASVDEVLGACNMFPFMSEKRLVVIKDLDKANKALSEALIEYLVNPCETTLLACTATKLAKNTRLYKAFAKIDKKAVVSCEPKSKKELPQQVCNFAQSHGVDMDMAAAGRLVDMVGESTVHLDTEVKKMAAALGKGARITVETVEQYVMRTAEVKPWEYLDPMCDRNATKALSVLAQMPGQSPFALLTMGVKRVRELLMAKELGAGQALAGALGLPEWRVRNHGRWASRFSQQELERALVAAADTDMAMKSGVDQDAAFKQWVLGVCVGF